MNSDSNYYEALNGSEGEVVALTDLELACVLGGGEESLPNGGDTRTQVQDDLTIIGTATGIGGALGGPIGAGIGLAFGAGVVSELRFDLGEAITETIVDVFNSIGDAQEDPDRE